MASDTDRILVLVDQGGVVGAFRTLEQAVAALGPFPSTAPEITALWYPCAGARDAAAVYAPPYRGTHVPAFVEASVGAAEARRETLQRANLVDPDDIERYWALVVGECTPRSLMRMRELEEWTQLKSLGEEVIVKQLEQDKKTVEDYLSGRTVEWQLVAPTPVPYSILDEIVACDAGEAPAGDAVAPTDDA